MSASSAGSRGRVALTIVVLAVAGVVLGALSVRILFGGTALVVIPWAVCCGVIGAVIRSRWLAVVGAAVFGFAVSGAFLVGGYSGSGSITGALGVFAVLAVISAVVAAAAALIVNVVASSLRRGRRVRR